LKINRPNRCKGASTGARKQPDHAADHENHQQHSDPDAGFEYVSDELTAA
jgi:hypothetical protein